MFTELSDRRIARAFHKSDLPVELLGDLRALIAQVKIPLGCARPESWKIRSSVLSDDGFRLPASL